MARVFPQSRRRRASGGGVGLAISHGTETESSAFRIVHTRDLGTEIETSDFRSAPTIDVGLEAESMSHTATGSAVSPQGTDTESDAFGAAQVIAHGSETETDAHTESITTSSGLDTGSMSHTEVVATALGSENEQDGFSASQSWANGIESDSFASDAVAQLSQHTTSATAITANTPAWSNPTNAQGAIDGTEASHPGLNGVDVSCDATLRCAGLVVPSTPSGFTRTAVGIRIVHRWDLTISAPVAGVTDVVHTIRLLTSADVLIATLNTRSAAGGGGTQSTLLTEDYDITALVSEAQLAAGVKIDCHVDADYVPATNGNSSWNVDAVHLRATYTRAGIN